MRNLKAEQRMRPPSYDIKKISKFYDFDARYGAAYNDIIESQYGIKDGKVTDPSRYYFFYEVLLSSITRYIGAGSVLLDIGCGAGILAEAAHDKVKKYVGIDVSSERIKQAKTRIKCANCSFLAQDAQHLEFPDSSFDAAVAIEVIEHIPDTDSFIAEVNRVLVKGGLFVLTTPTYLFFMDKTYGLYKDQHIYEFSIPRLKSILKKHGFSVECVTGIGFKFPRIVIPVWLGSDVIKYFYKTIRRVPLKAGYGKPLSLEFDIISNQGLNRMYFSTRWRSLAVTLMRIFGFLGSHFPFFSSNLVIICHK